MEEKGGYLPDMVIKEECLIFEEDSSEAFNAYGQYDTFLENCLPVKKEENDCFSDLHGDIKPKEEPDENEDDTSKPTENAGLYEPSTLLITSATEKNTCARTTTSNSFYLGAEPEKQDRTRNKQTHRKDQRTCSKTQDVSGSQDIRTVAALCNDRGEKLPPCNNIRVPADDDLLHCHECSRRYEGDCPKHGPLIIVEDTPVPVNVNNKYRAKMSAPPQVSADATEVLALDTIPARTRFGPYEGRIVPPNAEAAFAWLVWKDGKPDHSVDASEPGLSNWMRFVNFARCDEEQNLAAFQYKGKIYFKTLRKVVPGEELMVSDLLVSDGKDDEDSGAHDAEKESGLEGDSWEAAADASKAAEAGTSLSTQNEGFICEDTGTSGIEKLIGSKPVRHRSTNLKPRQDKVRELSVVLERIEPPRNLLTPDNPRKFICPVCNKVFLRKSTFDIHQRLHNTDNLVSSDPQDNQTFERDHRKRARASTVKKLYACTKCGKQFGDRSKLTRHLRTHNGEKPFSCMECGMRFADISNLRNHIRNHKGEKPYACTQCSKRFSDRANLKTHLRTHNGERPYACTECGKQFVHSSSLRTHLHTHNEEKPFPCTECGKQFVKLSRLQEHLRTHSGEKPFACAECGKTFAVQSNVQKHLRTHNGEKPYVCSECGRRFSDRSNLMNHIRTHNGEKPFMCAKCGKQFAVQSNLQRHLQIHDEGRQYACYECGKRFTEKLSCQKHLLTYHREKPFSCTECSKRFAHRSLLQLHMRTHSGEKPYACTECDKRFAHSSILQTHIRTHTGEKPYSCNKCGKEFSQLSSQQRHLRIHNGEKAYACSLCGKRYARISHLQDHLKTHNLKKVYSCTEWTERLVEHTHLQEQLQDHNGEKTYASTSSPRSIAGLLNL